MVKVSVIVPVYNVDKYLHRCLEGIMTQTCMDWECILVDDGSTDNSGSICEEYSRKDKRFSCFHTKNSGVGSARNFGLDIATGKYVVFIDSDDWVEKDYLQSLLDAIVNVTCNVLVRQNVKNDYTETGGQVVVEPFSDDVKADNTRSAIELIERYDLLSKGAPWGKLYSMDIIRKHNLRFPEDISFHEDHYFVLRYIKYLLDGDFMLVVGSVPYYHYMHRSALSLTKKQRPVGENIRICWYMTDAIDCIFSQYMFSKGYKNSIYTMAFVSFVQAAMSASSKADFRALYDADICQKYGGG